MWIAASVADVAAVNPNGIKTLLANGLSTFFIKENPVFSNGPKCLPKILVIVLFYAIDCDNFILADEPFAKALRSLDLCGKLF